MAIAKRHIRAIVFALMFLCHGLFAQEASKNEWFLETSPSLLFSVSSLTTYSYQGGVGIGFQRSPDALWRIAVIVSHRSESSTRSSDYPFHDLRKGTESQLSLFVSPLFPIRNWDAFYVFTAPSVQGGNSWSSSDFERMDISRVSTWSTTRSIWNIAGGFGFGVGATISKRISLTAEYRISLSYTREYADDTRFKQVSSFEMWSFSTYASLTLMYKL